MRDEVISMLLTNVVHFGFDASQKLGEQIAAMGGKNVLVITDKGVVASGIADKIKGIIADGGYGVDIFDDVMPEPTIECLETCVETVKKNSFDVIVGLGGGSPMDIASVTAVMLTNEGNVRDYCGANLLKKPGIPTIVIPTTAGTGAEATPNAVLADPAENNKKVVISPYILPNAAIIDPLLHLSMPPTVASGSGMDALAHAIEGYTHFTKANVMSDLYAREAIRMIARSLRTAVAKGDNLEARYDMALASYYAGVSIANAGVTAVHALSYPLGVEYHVPHGVANGMLLPYVMEFNILGNIPKFADIATLMGEEVEGLSLLEQAYVGADAVKLLLMDMKMAHTLTDLNIPKEAIPHMAEASVSNTRLMSVNPRTMTVEDAQRIYENAL